MPAASVAAAARTAAVTVPVWVSPSTRIVYVVPLPVTVTFPGPAVPPRTTSSAPNPDTGSLNTTANWTGWRPVTADGPAPCVTATLGGVLSIVYVGPVIRAVSAWPTRSAIPAGLIRSSRTVPSPVPVPTVTV